MYGIMPSAPRAQCSNAPPVNKLYIPSMELPAPACCAKKSASAFPFNPGIRTTASSRQMARTIRVKMIRDLSSGILKQLLKVLAREASIGQSISVPQPPTLGFSRFRFGFGFPARDDFAGPPFGFDLCLG